MSADAAPPPAASEPEAPAPVETARADFIAGLDAAKQQAAIAETAYRKEAAERAEALAVARAYAYRRAELMAALCASIAGVEDAEMAAAASQALLRARLAWDTDSDARAEVLSRFTAVAVALFDAERADPNVALAAFEDWYQSTRQSSFWYLFEHYMPDTPRIDF